VVSGRPLPELITCSAYSRWPNCSTPMLATMRAVPAGARTSPPGDVPACSAADPAPAARAPFPAAGSGEVVNDRKDRQRAVLLGEVRPVRMRHQQHQLISAVPKFPRTPLRKWRRRLLPATRRSVAPAPPQWRRRRARFAIQVQPRTPVIPADNNGKV
jgi:hypothetical protein